MKKILLAMIMCLLMIASMVMLPVPVHASNTMSITPSSAYVGMYRSILIDVKASDTAIGMWQTGVWAVSSTVPTGVYIDFNPSYVNFASSIESTMRVYAGPAASPGTYSITIKAGWTTIIGSHWETQQTFTLQVETVSERDWAQNPSLYLQNPPNPTVTDRWYPGCRQWNWLTGQSWAVNNSQTLFALWNQSGYSCMNATSYSDGTVDQVAHLIQGLPEGVYQPPPVSLNPSLAEVNLKAQVSNISTNHPNASPLTWTGIKWDAYAVDVKDNRSLYIEMYFVRTGGNLAWGTLGQYRPDAIYASANELLLMNGSDDALLAIDQSSEYWARFVTIQTPSDGSTWFNIDLTGIFGYIANEYYTYDISGVWTNPSRINDYQLTQTALCLEANLNTFYGTLKDVNPSCAIACKYFQVKGSWMGDVNLDGKVDNTDLSMIAAGIGSLGSSSYLPNADLNHDGIVDIYDLVIAARQYGLSFPAPWLTISSGYGGTTNPTPQTCPYSYGTQVTVTALASSGYYFAYWYLDGSTNTSNPITVTMTADHSLTAYFYSNSGGGGGCPILYTYDGKNYQCEGLLNIHNPAGVDVTTNHTLTYVPGRVNGVYEFEFIEHPETVSHIDQVKLYAILQNGKTVNLPLIYAWHSEYGNVLPQLLFADGWKTIEYGAKWNNGVSQSIQMKFLALPSKAKIKAFIFQITGCNMFYKT
jgi:hypothetical protein